MNCTMVLKCILARVQWPDEGGTCAPLDKFHLSQQKLPQDTFHPLIDAGCGTGSLLPGQD